eukprot:497321-Hanusia_phi.AAC.1
MKSREVNAVADVMNGEMGYKERGGYATQDDAGGDIGGGRSDKGEMKEEEEEEEEEAGEREE